MDTTLFIIGLLLFAALYMALAVFLFWALLISVLVIMVYLAARYRNIGENYPYNVSESLTSVLMIAMTWTVFVLVGPKPIPFLGSTFTYNTYTEATVTGVVDALVAFTFVLLILFAIIVPWFEGRGGGMGQGGGGGEGGNITVGSG